ncbi:MAG: uracil-DNA glycosylase [Melioribacteraceae bacterium]|nr:uracil-DNA glycosylase [Melioribacteraceae bacterium]
MLADIKKGIIESLKDQRDIFGDDLYEKFNSIPISELNMSNTHEPSQKEDKMESFQNASNLEDLNQLICNCLKCDLGKTRTKFVFGVGNPNANAMLIGEAPGADEDKQGEPFVGRAGKLLNDILKAINLSREEVYIANILKCRPPGNRDPLPSEMETCIPYLQKQVDLIKPNVILCLGRIAANGLLNKKLPLSGLRETTHEFAGIPVIVTYHPAALLRNPNWKRGCWEDVQKFKKLLDELS